MGWLREFRQPINASRIHLDRFVQAAAASVPPGALVLDAGAGNGPYRRYFEHARYESADFMKIDKAYRSDTTYVCDLAEIPVQDARFDFVLITQVLEHLPDPTQVLREMRRVLKPGGTIWATCPFYYEEHEQPYDYFRFTQFALRKMFSDAGFASAQIDWLEGYYATIGYQLDLAARVVPQPGRAALRVLVRLLHRSDIRRKRTTVGHPKNYTVIATA